MAAPSENRLRVRLVQRASGLDPADNRAALDELRPAAGDTDLVVLPEAFARDFGEPGSDLAPYAETLDGPFACRGCASWHRHRDRLAGRACSRSPRTRPGR